MHYVYILLCIVQVMLGVGVIFIVAIQQTKNEGLGGTIGGRPTTSFKGKPGFEERLNEIVARVARAIGQSGEPGV